MSTLNDAGATLWASIVRTIVPIAVGWVISLLVTWGIQPDEGFSAALEGFLTLLFSGIWYIGGRLLEVYVSPRFGWLLGLAAAPDSYSRGKHAA